MELEVGGVDDYELLQPGEGEVVEGGQVEQLCHVRVLDSREPGHWTVGVLDSRHGICQKAYTGEVFKDQILPKSALISINAKSRPNSANDG